jgi:hypothetical protein
MWWSVVSGHREMMVVNGQGGSRKARVCCALLSLRAAHSPIPASSTGSHPFASCGPAHVGTLSTSTRGELSTLSVSLLARLVSFASGAIAALSGCPELGGCADAVEFRA